jgi:hypothetical protein
MIDFPYTTDVVELRSWASDDSFSLSQLKEELETILPVDDSENAEEYANAIFEELERRQSLLPNSYPFNVDGNTIVPNELKENSSYLFCLGLTFFDDISRELRTVEFETIATRAAESYFCGEAIRIGSPWKNALITDYRELLQLVSDRIPDIGPPTRTVAPAGGDGGWDVVVVKNFRDRQYSRIIALGNCATGKTDWLKKGRETEPSYFWGFFTHSPQEKNPCFVFSAIPFLMTDDQKRRKTGRDNLLFDRLRLCDEAPDTSETVMDWLSEHRAVALEISLI